MQRRGAIAAIVAGFSSPFLVGAGRFRGENTPAPDFAAIERKVAGRVGVAALDVPTRRHLTYRAAERFPMCSTFKWLLAAQVLSLADAGQEQLSRIIPYSQSDLLDYAPVARAHVGAGGMTLSELLAAAIQYSDNTAANLLLRVVGGPSSFTAYVRHLGDGTTRLDRTEPDLNSAVPGDVRDTTTPNAMVADMEALLIGDQLASASRAMLLAWLLGLAIAWRGPQGHRDPGKLDAVGTFAWVAVFLTLALWELTNLLLQPSLTTDSYAHPTISVMSDPALASHLGRSVAVFGWLLFGWFLIER